MPRVTFALPSLRLCFPSLLDRPFPSLPPTVRDVDVPLLFREQFILTGYRPVGLPWRCYTLSLFQIHNETLNVWSHLLAAVCVLIRFMAFTVLQGGGILGFRLQGPEGQGFSVDASSLPLVLYVFSAVTYLSCSAAAHLLQSHTEQAHRFLSVMHCAGVGIHQYGCTVALCIYSSDAAWTQSVQGQLLLLAAAFLAWFCCTMCCFARLHFHGSTPPHRKLCQVLLYIGPIAHRLMTHRWLTSPALLLHFLQVVLFLLSAIFFSCPIPECFFPGYFDIIGHSHQLFHILLSFCTLIQQEALYQDFLWRRPALVREFGERHLLLACASFLCLIVLCMMTAFFLMRRWCCANTLRDPPHIS